jgi:hypothetical protein
VLAGSTRRRDGSEQRLLNAEETGPGYATRRTATVPPRAAQGGDDAAAVGRIPARRKGPGGPRVNQQRSRHARPRPGSVSRRLRVDPSSGASGSAATGMPASRSPRRLVSHGHVGLGDVVWCGDRRAINSAVALVWLGAD